MTTPQPWSFPEWGDPSLADHARPAAGDVAHSLELARGLCDLPPRLGRDTWSVLRTLATLGAVDLTTARTVEPHLDALAILHQAGVGTEDPRATWGVYASAAPGVDLRAQEAGDGWRLTGLKPWCSLAGSVSHALVTAPVSGGGQGLFAVDLTHPGVTVESGRWVARGLREVTTGSLAFDGVPARAVGEPGWYLRRPGFAWGGIGVAAVWFGGAAALGGALWAAARRRAPDQVALLHLGAVDATLHAALTTLRAAAADIDAGRAGGEDGAVLAARVRAVLAEAAERVLTAVGHALGPGPLAHDDAHAARVADLGLYLRQHHAERDLAALGRLTLAPAPAVAGGDR